MWVSVLAVGGPAPVEGAGTFRSPVLPQDSSLIDVCFRYFGSWFSQCAPASSLLYLKCFFDQHVSSLFSVKGESLVN